MLWILNPKQSTDFISNYLASVETKIRRETRKMICVGTAAVMLQILVMYGLSV